MVAFLTSNQHRQAIGTANAVGMASFIGFWLESTAVLAKPFPSFFEIPLLILRLAGYAVWMNSTVLPSGSVTIAIVTPGRNSVTGTVGRMPLASSCAISPRISGTEIVK